MKIISLQALAPLATVYFTVVSILYSLGFWSGFNITILDYMTISDVVKAAIKPLVGSFITITAAVIFSEFVLVRHFPIKIKIESDGDESLNRRIRTIDCILKMAFTIAAITIFLSLFLDREVRWQIIGTIVTFFIWVFVDDTKITYNISGNPLIKKIITFVCIFILCASYGDGVRDSYYVKEYGQRIMIENNPVNKKLVGVAGDYMFFWNEDGDVVDVVRRDSIKSIQISPVDSGPIFKVNWSDAWNKISSYWSS